MARLEDLSKLLPALVPWTSNPCKFCGRFALFLWLREANQVINLVKRLSCYPFRGRLRASVPRTSNPGKLFVCGVLCIALFPWLRERNLAVPTSLYGILQPVMSEGGGSEGGAVSS